jgi:general secretion pathway protein A
MYLSFYGLKKQPFHITPDPEFLYLSPSHKEALAAIIYGVEEKKGFVAITGDVGTGKTTILRSYLDGKKDGSLKIIYIFNAKLSFEGLLKTIYRELGLPVESDDAVEMVNKLYEVLIEEYRQQKTVVLVVDEAQNMPVDTLESLRMISNLETSKDKLIQIVLVGQPEFERTLNSDRLRQLKQRVAIRATILPLTKSESLDYITFRLQKAGAPSSLVFTAAALKEIIKKAQGVPRVLNVLCDNALITGLGYEQKPVTEKIAKEVIRDAEGGPIFVRRRLSRAAALALFLVILAIAAFLPLRRVGLDYMATPAHHEKVNTVEESGPVAKDDEVRQVPQAPPLSWNESVVAGETDVSIKKSEGTEKERKPVPVHSVLRRADGKVYGLWLLDPAQARDRRLVASLLSEQGLPAATLLRRGYRVVPNDRDAAGVLIIFGSPATPEEAPARQDGTAGARAEAVRPRPEGDAVASYNRALALYREGLLDEAVEAYREALRINPGNASAHYNLGLALYHKGLLDEAIQAYRQALRINPENVNAHTNLGIALYRKGLLDEAIEAYHEALRINPQDALTHLNLGIALKDKGLAAEAAKAFEEFVKYAPPQYAGEVERMKRLAESLRAQP